jgi:outer membrane receptor protein involved in Fe transport
MNPEFRRRPTFGLTLGIFLVAGFLLVSGLAQAQQPVGHLQGRVFDESGALLPGVSVVVTNIDTGAERPVITNAQGFWSARSLQPGRYTLTGSLEGMQTVQREDIELLVGQVLDVDMTMQIGATTDLITVTGESPLIEVSRSEPASYITAQEIQNIPIVGRDFKQFALLNPTVREDSQRGFITMSGQRGVYSGMNIDGASGKNAFFGYGNGGEATENDGLVVAQESVKEFQVIQNGFAPEYGLDGGGFINVVTKSGTNEYHGSAFYYTTDESLAEDIPATPVDKYRDPDAQDIKPDEFNRQNWGLTGGGPIVRDKAHFFLSYDHTQRTNPFVDRLSTRGAYDAVLQRAQTQPEFADLLIGYTPNNDGVAAPDPVNGRTAQGLFERDVDNVILLGKFDFYPNDIHSASLRYNYTDYERTSTFLDEESLKQERVDSIIGSWVMVVGDSGLNDFRFQYATDDLNRGNLRDGSDFVAQVRFQFPETSSDSLGKFDFLPIVANTQQFEFRENFSYFFGKHDTKFGIHYSSDNMAQLFAGSRDGRYDYRSMDNFLNNVDSAVRIYFGNVQYPNYDETQDVWAIYAQDMWKPTARLSVNYGLRWGKTDNPSGLEHVLAVGQNIPDDDHISPRVGFAWQLSDDGRDVLRGGYGVFYGRTPTLLFASQVQENGLYPNYGRVVVSPGQTGHVPLGTPINNESPPVETIPSTSYLDPSFRDARNQRFNLGYERQIGSLWTASVDLLYSEGDFLQRNYNDNIAVQSLDQYGRPDYGRVLLDPNFNTIFVRRSDGTSEYTAITLKAVRRFAGRYSLQAHYTWSEDKDDDSNERNATDLTVSNQNDPGYDYGISDRDVPHRFVLVGTSNLPLGFRVSGTAKYESGTPWTAHDPNVFGANCSGPVCPAPRAIIGGGVVDRNTFRNDSITQVDVRAGWVWGFRDSGELELFAEVFNLFNESAFSVDELYNQTMNAFDVTDQQKWDPAGSNAEFGLEDVRVSTPRFIQFGVRVRI